jgi:hypothetical protein
VISEPLKIAAPQDAPTAAETASQAASRDSGAFEDSQPSHLDQGFIERQYRYLMGVHAGLVADADGLEIAESGVNREKRGIAIELEDDAQRLAQLEIDGMLVARDVNRRDREKSSAEDCGTHIWNFRSER